MKKLAFAGVLSFAALATVSAAAQDASLPASFATLELSNGFTPDPTEVSVVAGGAVQVTAPGCSGYIADAPDVELTYAAGSWPLNIYYIGDGDATLVINGPDGSWICNDDANGFNPAVSIATPGSGVYDIWVGTYAANGGVSGTLKISEVAPQW